MNSKPCVAAVAALLIVAAAPARAERDVGIGPCDELVAYLHDALAGEDPSPMDYRRAPRAERTLEDRLRSSWHNDPPAYTARVTPACREAIRRGRAPAALHAAQAWTQRREAGWIDRGRIVRCAMQDPAALDELAAWMAEAKHPEARAVCASALATWPDAGPQRSAIFAAAVRERDDWPARQEVDPAIVAAANALGSPELHEQLVPLLVAAHDLQAAGYDRLRDGVCANDAVMSRARDRACSTLPLEAEDDWRVGEQRIRRLATAATTVVFAGVLAAAMVERDSQTGRDVETGALVGLGAAIGGMAGAVLVAPILKHPPKIDAVAAKILFGGLVACGALAGGVVGGMVAHSHSTSPATTTAVALTPAYLIAVLALNFDESGSF